MHIWSPSLCLTLICFIRSVHSRCSDDSECGQLKVCDSSSGKCVTPSYTSTGSWLSRFPTSKITSFKQYTPDIDRCYDSQCLGTSTCVGGRCVDRKDDYNYNDTTDDSDKRGFSWSTTKIVGVVFFAAVAAVISCLYHMCKKARRPPVNSHTATGVTGEGTNIQGTDHEMGPTGNAVSNGGVVIAVEEVNEVSPPLPPGAPPPYSTLEFEPQQRNENEEQPPPSYEEAVQNSTMGLV